MRNGASGDRERERDTMGWRRRMQKWEGERGGKKSAHITCYWIFVAGWMRDKKMSMRVINMKDAFGIHSDQHLIECR